MNHKTYSTKENDIQRSWHLFDLKNQVLGRVSSEIAKILIGKHKPYFTPHLDCGDYVIAVNARDISITGKKQLEKMYYRHSGYPGGFRQFTFKQMMDKDPRKVIELAVGGMLPKNKLRDRRLNRLKVFLDDQHPYQDKLENKKESQLQEKTKKIK